MPSGAEASAFSRPWLRVLRLASVHAVPDDALARARTYDPVGGMQNHTAHLSFALDRLGVAQTVVTAYRPGAMRVEPLGVHGEVLRVGVPVRLLRQGWGAAAAIELMRLPRRFAIVHAHLGEDIAVLPLALATARRLRTPLVMTIHCSLRHTLVVTGVRSAFLRIVGGALETMTERRAAAVITLTERLAVAIGRSGVPPQRIYTIPSGVPLAQFGGSSAAAKLPRPAVVHVGRLHPQKGVETLVRATARLSGIQLILVGDGPERAAVQRLAAKLGVADRVHITGFVPHSRVAEFLAGADIVALPSRYEELGTALIEAMAVGCPIVASRVGGIPELVRDGVDGLLVPPCDDAALAATISRLLHDPPLAASLARSARARAVPYDWCRLARRVLAVYTAALGAGPAGGSALSRTTSQRHGLRGG